MVTKYGDGAVEVERDDGVATLRLALPEKRNALSIRLSTGIVDALADLEGSETRCVLVEGDGPAFSAGGDVEAMVERKESDTPPDEAVRHVIQHTARCVKRLAECEFPTVAAVDGPAFGAGANLALACDVQLLSDDARMSFGFRQVGLAIDSGTSYFLPRLVGDNVARELVFTGELLDAERAASLGLANHVYPAEEYDDRVAAFVERVASGPTVALRASKRLLRDNRETSLSTAIDHEAAVQASVFESADHAEGVRAFKEEREPAFEGR